MKHIFVLALFVMLLTASGCSPANISTRQNASAEALNAAVTIEIVASPVTVSRGGTASLTAKGAPNQLCSIAIHLSSGISKAKGLEPCETDENGFVTWTWKVSSQTKPGVYRITVTCGAKSEDVYFTVE